MTITKVTIPAIAGTTVVTIARPMGDALEPEPTGHRMVRAALGRWGVDGSGVPYFDAGGVVEAERATVSVNTQNDHLVLVPERVQDGEIVRMRRGRGRAYPPGGHVRFAMGPLVDPRPVLAGRRGAHVRFASVGGVC